MIQQDSPIDKPKPTYSDRLLAICGSFFIFVSAASFAICIYRKFYSDPPLARDWLGLVEGEASTLILIVVGIVTAILGKQLLSTERMSNAQTIPEKDLPLISEAVKEGKSEPIDQYVRLRSLSGFAGNFTKIGITGLPLTTVGLTLVFALIALCNEKLSRDFLDFTKLTLGAFIGSFVQRQVERKASDGSPSKGELIA